MKYYYEKPEKWTNVGSIYYCDAPLYNACTLFRNGNIGIAIIQEHYDPNRKVKWWGPIKPWIAYDIWRNPNFGKYMINHASEPNEKGIYPTIQLRQLMWKLRMKPLKKEFWEENIYDE